MSDPEKNRWRRSSLIGLADYHNGAAFNPKFWADHGLPIIRIEQINDPSAPTDLYNGPLSPLNRIGDGDLVFSWSATLKAVLWKHGPGALNQHLFKVVPKSGVDKEFLFHILDHNMERIASGSHGSTMKHITRKELQRYKVELPVDEDHQRHIATILTTLDELIEATEKLVEKHQQIKAGLMHDLFTRGLWTRHELARGDHKGLPCEATAQEGQLRPPPDEAPGLYRDSPLGLIPKAWGMRTLTSVASYQHGRPFPSSDYAEAGVILLRPGNLDPGGVVRYDDRHTTRIPPKWLRECPDLIVSLDDILMNLTAQSLEDQFLGRVCIVRDSEPAMLNQRIARFTPKGVEHHYLYWLLRSIQFRSQIDRTSQGTKVQHIYNSDLNRVQFAVPSDPDEQRSISGILFSANEQIESDQTYLAKLRQQKQGLMHDLLTGRVRVSAELQTAG